MYSYWLLTMSADSSWRRQELLREVEQARLIHQTTCRARAGITTMWGLLAHVVQL